MWRSRVRHTLDKTSCLIKHQNKPQQYRHFVLKQRLNLGNEWGLVCGAVWAACRDAISLWPINSPFVLLKTTDWPGLVRAEAGQTINKLVASSLQIQSVAGPLGPISGDATVWKQRRAEEESPYFTPFWILIRMKQMSQALIVSWTARHGDVTLARRGSLQHQQRLGQLGLGKCAAEF